uniref:Uncharacterized protein n=1 Tax=Anguilla anguilla TaxID=7936 RepID=A0A0E9WFJ2_ANGAN
MQNVFLRGLIFAMYHSNEPTLQQYLLKMPQARPFR